MKAIIRKQQKRVLESNKRSAFRVRKRPVPRAKIDRYITEHNTASISGNYDKHIDGNTEPVGMIPAVSMLNKDESSNLFMDS